MPIKKDKKKKPTKPKVINSKGSINKKQSTKSLSQSLTVNVNLGKKGRKTAPKAKVIYQTTQPVQPVQPIQSQQPDYISILGMLLNKEPKVTTSPVFEPQIVKEERPIPPKRATFNTPKKYYDKSGEITEAEELQYNYDFGVPGFAMIYPEIPVANAEYAQSEVETTVTKSSSRRGRPKRERTLEDIEMEKMRRNEKARERYWKKKEAENTKSQGIEDSDT